MTTFTRRTFIGSAGLLAGFGASASSRFPDKPITVVVPSVAGGSPDTVARLFSRQVQTTIGQPLVVENVSGASGVIGIQRVLRAPNDGHCLLYGYNQLVTINPFLLKNLPYDPVRDLAPVSLTADLGYIWIANPSFGPGSVAEWIEHMKRNPGKVNFGTQGTGSAAHLGGELLMQQSGTRMTAVPYKGSSTPDLLAGVIDVKMEPYTTAIPLVQSGKVKALAATGAQRVALLPNLPTLVESFPGHVIRGWHAIWLRAGSPASAVDTLQREFAAAAGTPAVRDRLRDIGLSAVSSTPEELRQLIASESRMWSQLIKERGIEVS